MVVRKGGSETLCTYPLIRKCSKPFSEAVGNPWRYGPVHIHSYQHSRGKRAGVTYRPAAVVTLAALHTVPSKLPNTTAGVASLPDA